MLDNRNLLSLTSICTLRGHEGQPTLQTKMPTLGCARACTTSASQQSSTPTCPQTLIHASRSAGRATWRQTIDQGGKSKSTDNGHTLELNFDKQIRLLHISKHCQVDSHGIVQSVGIENISHRTSVAISWKQTSVAISGSSDTHLGAAQNGQ